MAGSDWFSQFAQSMIHPTTGLPSTAAGRPGNLIQSMGTGGFTNPLAIPNSQPNTPQLGAPDFLQNLFHQLLNNSQVGSSSMSPGDILRQATKTAASQYDPQISAIDRQMSRAKTTAGKNKKELANLYGAGADAYNQDITASKSQGKAAVADEKARQADLQGKLKSNYSSSLDDQMKQFQTLGIQDALPQATSQQRNDLNYLGKLNDTQGQANLSDLNAENNADINYYNEGKGVMRLTGNEVQSDLMSQLTDYLNSQGDARSSLQGQRQAAIAQLQQQLTSDAAKQAQQNQQGTWDNLYKMFGLYQGMNPQQKPATSGLNASSQYLAGATTPQKAQDTMSALNLLLGQGFNTGQKNSSGQPIFASGAEQAANVGVNYANKNGWAPADTTGLMQAILAYYGRMGG